MSRYPFEKSYGGGGGPTFAWPRLTPVVKYILIANAAVQVVQFVLAGQLTPWLGCSGAKFGEFAPWGLLSMFTYMWVHSYVSLGHVVFNMLVLYFFGTMVEERLGRKRFLRLYLLCGLMGSVFWLGASAIMGLGDIPVVGASGCCYGIIAYAALVNPQARVILIIFPIRLWVIAAGLALFAVYDTAVELRAGPMGRVAHAAHLGGMVFALLWWRFEAGFGRLGDRLRARAAERERLALRAREEEVDRILAKIKEAGMGGLTGSERRFLKRYSRDRQE